MKTLKALFLITVGFGIPTGICAADFSAGIATIKPKPSHSAAGSSFNPQFSAEGRHLVFVSQANNLGTNDDKGQTLDIFVHDLVAGKNVLLSVSTNGSGGANLDALYPNISSNGQRVAFASAASNLVPGDNNQHSDVFVRDLVQGVTWLVSLDTNGTANADGDSTAPLISADGSRVVFVSQAANLVASEFTTNQAQIFLHDLATGQTRLVSVNESGTGPCNGPVFNPTVSADAQWVAFESIATDLTAGATNTQNEIYLRNLSSNTTTWASAGVADYFLQSTNGYRCFKPVLNQAGTQLAFKAMGNETNRILLFLRDLASGVTTCITSNALETGWPELSADGRWLVYESETNVFVWDSQLETNLLVNVSADGINPGNGPAKNPTISANGNTVVFLSSATDLMVVGNTNPPTAYQIYSRDLVTGQTRLVSRTSTGETSTGIESFIYPVMSANGQSVAFESANECLVDNDRNRASDVFFFDTSQNVLHLVSISQDNLPGRSSSGAFYVQPKGLSADGRFALLLAFDSSLADGDTNRIREPYLIDLSSGTNVLISPPTNSLTTNVSGCYFPALNATGNRVAFLTQGNRNNSSDGYVYDYRAASLTLFSTDPNGSPVWVVSSSSTFHNFELALSPEGNRLVFISNNYWLAGTSGSSARGLFYRDLAVNTNRLLTASYNTGSPTGESYSPQFSADGRWVVFSSTAAQLTTNALAPNIKVFAWDSQNDKMRLISLFATNGNVSPDSRFVVAQGINSPFEVFIHDLWAENPTNVVVATNAQSPVASYDAEFVAFQSLPTNGITHVFAKDMLNDRLELLSVAPDGVTPGDGLSGPPQIHPFGRYVLFSSKASNLVPYDDNGFTDVFLRDRAAGVTYLLSANPQTGHSGNGPSTSPLMSADGSTILFASHANDLVAGDYNDKQDIFVVKLGGGDSDGDGLDDAWELAYLNTLIYNGDADPDSDGMSNAKEYRAGTDPTNRGSVLRALVMGQPGGGSTTVMWPVAAGKTYKVQYKTLVTDAEWTDLTATIEITGDTARATDLTAGLAAQRFYRVVLVE